MNRVELVGRLTKDVEVRKTQSNLSVASFTVACDRRVSRDQQNQGQQTADFISCVAWRQTADFLGSYARKGAMQALKAATGSFLGFITGTGLKTIVSIMIMWKILVFAF